MGFKSGEPTDLLGIAYSNSFSLRFDNIVFIIFSGTDNLEISEHLSVHQKKHAKDLYSVS